MARSVRDGSRRDTILFVGCIVLALVVRALPDTAREPIASVLRQTLVAPLLHLQRNAERTRSAWLSYEGLTVSRDSIALRAMQVHTLEGENDRLRQLLALGARLESGFIPAEALHGQLLGEETTVMLSVGSDAGVQRYAPVVAPEGLAGVVQTVDPTMSVAILWTHPQFSASAKSVDGKAFGIVKPHLTDSDRPERFLLELQGVQFRNALDTGTIIVTAGLGGVFPAGIPIGTVLGEIVTPELWSRTYLIRPAVPPPEVRSVMILKQDRVGGGSLQRVWTLPRADSISRAVARAGDSVVRRDRAIQDAAAKAAAQQTADSVASAPPVGAPAPVTRPVQTAPPAQPPIIAPRPVITLPPPVVPPPPPVVPPPPPIVPQPRP